MLWDYFAPMEVSSKHWGFSEFWREIGVRWKRWEWRIYTVIYGGYLVCFYIWLWTGYSFVDFIAWTAPLIVGFFTRVLYEVHSMVHHLAGPESVTRDQCVALIFQQLERIARRKQDHDKPICIDILGVALHHSHDWIEKSLKDFMKEFPKVRVDLRIAFVEASILQTLDFNEHPVNWVEESKDRADWVERKLVPYANCLNGRLRLHVRTIRNLPHWHGIMLERRYLYMGRVSWLDGTERSHKRPTQLTCAENGYRVFSTDDRYHGEDRVALFRRWIAHYLYGNHEGIDLANTISGSNGGSPHLGETNSSEFAPV